MNCDIYNDKIIEAIENQAGELIQELKKQWRNMGLYFEHPRTGNEIHSKLVYQNQINMIRANANDMISMYLKNKSTKLISKTGAECDLPLLHEVQFCPHCGKMICPEIITKLFNCNYCHHCGGKVEY